MHKPFADILDEKGGVPLPMVLWYFWIYSFLGLLLERLFAQVTRSPRRARRCFLLSPLCPVYGLGMLAVLALPRELPLWGLILLGGLAATAVEYAVHWAYEALLGVRFWDYSAVPGNLRGRVCLPFSLAWAPLTAAAVRWVQPAAEQWAAIAPPMLTWVCLLAFTADACLSARYLWVTGDVAGLRAS